jgi:hypothetical protein
MGAVRCALLEFIRKPVKYILLCIIFIAVFTGAGVGMIVYYSADTAREELMEQIGAYLMLAPKDDNGADEISAAPELDLTILAQLEGIEYVSGVNQTVAEYALPLDFVNVREHTGPEPEAVSPQNDGLSASSVAVEANRDCRLVNAFRLKEAELVKGEYPSENSTGVLVEEHMAEANGLDVGDTVALHTAISNKVETPVTGIYRYNGYFLITEDNGLGDAIYALSPYNRIYSSLDVGEALFGVRRGELPLYIYVDQPQHNDSVGSAIKALDFDWHSFGLYNMTASDYEVEGRQIATLFNYAKLILFYVMAMGLVFLSLVLSLYMRYALRDAGILFMLGAGLGRVVGQNLLSLFLAGVISSLCSLAVMIPLGKRICATLIKDTVVSGGVPQMLNGFNRDLQVRVQNFAIREFGLYYGLVFLLILASVLPLLIKLWRKTPRELVLSNE